MKLARRWFEEICTEDSFGYVSPIIYTQGCSLKCKGCHNQPLQDLEGGEEISVTHIFDRVVQSAFKYNAVTFQGGEPLDQMGSLLWLLRKFKEAGIITVVYTGYKFKDIPKTVYNLCDIIKCGPYGSKQTVYHKIPLRKTVKNFQYMEVF